MNCDGILAAVGEFGRYQKILIFLLWLSVIPIPWCSLSNTFFSASTDHYCRVFANQTYQQDSPLKNCTIPYDASNGWDQCHRYDINVSDGISPDVCFPRDSKIKCDNGWVYDRSTYENTVVFDFNLVCDKDWMKELSKSIVGVGQLAGGVVLGQLADIFGRKPVIIVGAFLITLTGVGTAFSPWFPMFVVGQFLISALGMGVYLTVFILGTEYVGPTYRTASSILVMTGFSVGFVALSGIAYGLQGYWRHLQLVTGSVYFLFLAHCWLLPESARWLIQKKKYQKAESIIKKMAKINSALIPEKLFPDEGGSVQEPSTDNTVTVDIVKVKDRQNTMLDLFKTPKLRSRTLNLCFNWFTNSFVYYGISFNTDALHANPYVSSAILAAVEIPAALPAWWTIHKYGRRWPLCLSMALCGLFLSGSAFVSNPTAVIVLVVAAKCSNSVSFSTIFIFTAELFPTTVRNSGIGITSTLARFGTIMSPYAMLLVNIWHPLPFFVIGLTSCLAGALGLLLPETLNRDLPDTLEEGETFETRKTTREKQVDGHGDDDSLPNDDNDHVAISSPHAALISNDNMQ
ncbi:organic cation transporter protein-like isoform X2 [Ptychodera flava]|uniref:organic cation transporter protein-like isoform X2 n=1 Tax=Ptychodera flava TaxID=63121 RepID=UPI003969F886